jgi:hypothetical protein
MRERYADFIDRMTELTAGVDIAALKAEQADAEQPITVVSVGLPGHGKRR